MKIFTIYDNAAKAFMAPIFCRHENEAKRILQTEVNNPQSNLHLYTEDYALFSCGEFNPQNGEFITPDYPVKVCSALEMKALDKSLEEEKQDVNEQ